MPHEIIIGSLIEKNSYFVKCHQSNQINYSSLGNTD